MHSVEQSIIKDTGSPCDRQGGVGGADPQDHLIFKNLSLSYGGCGSSSQFSPQKTSRHSSGGGGGSGGAGGGGGSAGGGSSGFIAGRRSRSASPSAQQEKHPSHHERGQKKVRVFFPALPAHIHKHLLLARRHHGYPRGDSACPLPSSEATEDQGGAEEVTCEGHRG